jgi:hypothetical protein
MCSARRPLPQEIARIFGRGVREGFDVGVVRLHESFFDLRAMLSHDGPMLVVLCHTADESADLRLAAKRQFMTYGGPCHWLCAVELGGGPEKSWQTVAAHMSRLSARVGTAALTSRG